MSPMMKLKFDANQLQAAATEFKELQDKQQQLQALALQLIGNAATAAGHVAELIKPLVNLTVDMSDASLQIGTGKRTLTLVAVEGMALDSRLSKPRGKVCAQVFIFGHLSDKEEGTLLNAIRIYDDQHCTDGESDWLLSDGDEGILPFMARTISDDLLCRDVSWPPINEVEPVTQTLSLRQVQSTAPLKNQCIGFECSLERNGRKN